MGDLSFNELECARCGADEARWLDTWDGGIEPDRIAAAQEDHDTPEDFVLWFGEKYGLTLLSERSL